MSEKINASSLRRFVESYRSNVEKRSLMYGGSLHGVEAIWHVLSTFEEYAEGNDVFSEETSTDGYDAYATIAERYRCGNLTLSSKLDDEMGCTREASEELIRRLKEVDALNKQKRDRNRKGG